MSEALDQTVKRALEGSRGDWPTVAKESGVSYSWLSKFCNGHIENPGYETLKTLKAYFLKSRPELISPKRKKAEA